MSFECTASEDKRGRDDGAKKYHHKQLDDKHSCLISNINDNDRKQAIPAKKKKARARLEQNRTVVM